MAARLCGCKHLVPVTVPLVAGHVAASSDGDGRSVCDGRVDGSGIAGGSVGTGSAGSHVDGGSDGDGCGS